MNEDQVLRARKRAGVVARSQLVGRSSRVATRSGLREVQPGAFLARTQPYDVPAQLASLKVSYPGGGWTVMGEGALWLMGLAEQPATLTVGIPLASELAVRRPIHCRRVAASILRGSRECAGSSVVALGIAVIQSSFRKPAAQVRPLIETLLRERRTTIPRLRGRLGRGIAGSAVVRRVIDDLVGGSLEVDVRRLKVALEACGVVGLACEVRFVNGAGASAYADLLHWPTMTVIEVDGLLDHLERARFRADRRRDRWMLREHAARTLRVEVCEVRADVVGLAQELSWFLLPERDRVAS